MDYSHRIILIKRSLMLAIVPAAVAFSCQSTTTQIATPTDTSNMLASARLDAARSLGAASTEVLFRPERSSEEKKEEYQKLISTVFQNTGFEPKAIAEWGAYAKCVSALDPSAYARNRNERRTGLFLVPDSRRTSCGYGDVKIWQFRARMMEPAENINCAARLARLGWTPNDFQRCTQPALAKGLEDTSL
jgi:hypothetical protein